MAIASTFASYQQDFIPHDVKIRWERGKNAEPKEKIKDRSDGMMSLTAKGKGGTIALR